MSIPHMPRVDMEQAVADLVESIALQGAAVASLINAEAAKIDALVAAGIPAAESTAEVESFQGAVAGVIHATTQKQEAANQALDMARSIFLEMLKSQP